MRRFHRLAAVLELAEQEFLEIRKKKDSRQRSASVRVAAKAPGTPVTPESLIAFIEESEFVKQTDSKVAEVIGAQTSTRPNGRVLKIMADFLTAIGIDTIQQVEDNLRDRGEAAVEFLVRRRAGTPPKPGAKRVDGISIFQVASFIAMLKGADAYAAIASKANIAPQKAEVLQRQVAIAQEIAKSLSPQG